MLLGKAARRIARHRGTAAIEGRRCLAASAVGATRHPQNGLRLVNVACAGLVSVNALRINSLINHVSDGDSRVYARKRAGHSEERGA